jgi:hypothetical protein
VGEWFDEYAAVVPDMIVVMMEKMCVMTMENVIYIDDRKQEVRLINDSSRAKNYLQHQ